MDDATYFDEQWQRLFSSGEIPRVVPDDETIWRRDLGRARRIAFEWLGDICAASVSWNWDVVQGTKQ